MISTLLDRLFQRSNVTSGAQVKQRLKFILAHDRAAIEPQVFENMRHEIMRVVSRYVELDEGSLDIRLESDKRMTALIANLPIRMVREELPDLVSLFDQPDQGLTEGDRDTTDIVALEMDRFADEALDAIAAQESIKNLTAAKTDSTVENSTAVAERTAEVSQKLRTAANKPSADRNDDGLIAKEPVGEVVPLVHNQVGELLDQVDDEQAQSVTENSSDQAEAVNGSDASASGDAIDQLELSLDIPSDSSQPASNPLTEHEIVVDESHEIFEPRQE